MVQISVASLRILMQNCSPDGIRYEYMKHMHILGRTFVPLEIFDFPFTSNVDKIDYFRGHSIRVCPNFYLTRFYANLDFFFFFFLNQHKMRANKHFDKPLYYDL